VLKSLHIENYVLIDQLTVSFESGFSVVTGETGAGKSIFLDALGLLSGKRADVNALSNKEKKCVVEGTFHIAHLPIQSFFVENELDYDNITIIRREITPVGKSRAFVNDTPVNLNQLKELAVLLIDIHSQHQTLQINDTHFQFEMLDVFCNHTKEVLSYKEEFQEYKFNKQQLKILQDKEAKIALDKDYFEFLLQELEIIDIGQENFDELQQELVTLENTEEIKSKLFYVEQVLGGDESILPVLKEVKNKLTSIKKYLNQAESLEERVNSSLLELEDIAIEISKTQDGLFFDQERITILTEQIDKINSLLQKHRVSNADELIQIKNDLAQKLADMDSVKDEITTLESLIEQQTQHLKVKANQISIKRKESSIALQKEIVSMLVQLGMPGANFIIQLEKTAELTENGLDQVMFLFSANKGVQPQKLTQVASGGELSRLMLSLKAIAKDTTYMPTLLLDEIDTGVSGEIADKMATMMREISFGRQVISITHLPQIAAKGQHHYYVEKYEKNNHTFSTMKKLSKEERVNELAKMLSGEKLTEAAIKNAKELLVD
jgi:DNA repair protein RecN (Recombination protein N)